MDSVGLTTSDEPLGPAQSSFSGPQHRCFCVDRFMFDGKRGVHLESRLKSWTTLAEGEKADKFDSNSIMPLVIVIDFC